MDKKYKIDYNSNKPFNYITIAEDSMLPYYDKVLEKIKENNLSLDDKISKEKFRENIKKFNDYQRYIANYITQNGPDASKLYIKNLMGLNNLESDIIYHISVFTSKYFNDIEDHQIFKKTVDEQTGAGPGKTCVTLSLLLDAAGMIPGLGMAIDAFGVAVSLFCGDFFGAFLGMISIIPVAGWASGAIEIVRNMVKLYLLFTKMNKDDDEDEEEEDEEEDE